MSSNSTNNSSTTTDSYYQYICIGSTGIIFNILLLVVLFSDKNLLKKSAFVFGLTIGDIIDGAGLLTAGAVRIKRTNDNTINDMVHPSVCMTQFITPLFILGNQIPGIMFLLIGLERFIAVKYFGWFHKHWVDKLTWIWTFIAFVYLLISLGVLFVLTFNQSINTTVAYSCSTPMVTGTSYAIYNYMIPVISGFVALASSIASLIVFHIRRKRLLSNNSNYLKHSIKREWKTTKIFLVLAILDFGFLTVPSILSLLTGAFKVITIPNFAYYVLQVVCSRGAMNIFVYLFINGDFRKVAFNLIGIKLCKNSIQPSVTNIRHKEIALY